MWATSRGGRAVLAKLRYGAPCSQRRALAASAEASGEGGLEFRAARYPSFWSRLKQQRHGLGNMALSASICFLAVSIIRQEKEVTRATETTAQLRQENEALQQTLKSVLAKLEGGEQPLHIDGEAQSATTDSEDKHDGSLQGTPRSKFMV